jgi:hypothetical protein
MHLRQRYALRAITCPHEKKIPGRKNMPVSEKCLHSKINI